MPGIGLIVAVSGEGVFTDGMGLIIAFDAEGKVIGRSISKIHTGPQPFTPLSADLVSYHKETVMRSICLGWRVWLIIRWASLVG